MPEKSGNFNQPIETGGARRAKRLPEKEIIISECGGRIIENKPSALVNCNENTSLEM